MNNVKLGVQVMAEGLKVAFAVNHPLLAIGIKLLSDYKLALLGVAVGGLALKEALDIMEEQFQAINNIIAGAAKTGTSATLFQAWIEQAAHFGLSAKEAESALTHFGDVAKKELSGDTTIVQPSPLVYIVTKNEAVFARYDASLVAIQLFCTPYVEVETVNEPSKPVFQHIHDREPDIIRPDEN